MTRCDRCNNAPIIRRLDLCDVCVVEVNQLAARVAELEARITLERTCPCGLRHSVVIDGKTKEWQIASEEGED